MSDAFVQCHICNKAAIGFVCVGCEEEVCYDCLGPLDRCLFCLESVLDEIDSFVGERRQQLSLQNER